jgi:hypothetical protein
MRHDLNKAALLGLSLLGLGGIYRSGDPPPPAQQANAPSPLSLQGVRLTATGPAKIAQNASAGTVHLSLDNPHDGAGLDVRPLDGTPFWDLSTWDVIAVDVKSLSSDRQQRLVMTVTAQNEDGKSRDVTVGVGINPGETRTLRLPLPHRWKYAAPEGVPGVRVLDTNRITKISFAVQWPFETASRKLVDCELKNLRVENRLLPPVTAAAVAFSAPFLDQYGQFTHADWPGKIRTDADLKARFAAENTELAQVKRPTSWDRFGGWNAGPKRQATGSFRTEKIDGKWWLIDPEGRLFFSHGLDVISANGEALSAANRESWFTPALPTGTKSYNAVGHNLEIKYGTAEYRPAYYENLTKRLENWGMNSVGDWSATDLMALGRTPYTLQLTDYDYRMPRIKGSKLKFYDVFDPAYIAKMETLIETAAKTNPMVTKSLTDPMCIGYFIDNELDFGNRGKMTLVDDILRSPDTQAAKREFARDLEKKYSTIDGLNTAWGTGYADWVALLASTTVPDSSGYRSDAQVFFRKNVDQYFRLAHDAVKKVAPNRLYLGVRFISTDAVRRDLYEACQKHCDILSVNIYAHSAANFPTPAVGFPDMPVMVTEFQFGLLQRGMFSASLCQAGVTPEDRGLAYTRFVQGVLTHPNMVGAHYFQYRDQPLTGRGDGERYQIGFVDGTDTPYPEMTRAARAIGETMYTYRRNAGRSTPSTPSTAHR